LTDFHSGYSRTPNSPPSISIGTSRPDSAFWPRIRLSFHSSVVNVPTCPTAYYLQPPLPSLSASAFQHPRFVTFTSGRLPYASPLTYPRFITDSMLTALHFRRSCRSLSQGQVCNLHYPFPLVKSVSRRLLLSSALTHGLQHLTALPYYLLASLPLRTSPAAQPPARRVFRRFASANPLVRHKRKCYTTSHIPSNPFARIFT